MFGFSHGCPSTIFFPVVLAVQDFFLVITQRFSPLPLKYIDPCLSWGVVEEDGEFEPSLVVVQVLQQETIRMLTVAWQPYTKTVHSCKPVADPDFEPKRGPGFNLLAQPSFLPSLISSFFHP